MGTVRESRDAALNHVFPPGTPCWFCSTVPPASAAPGCNSAQELWRLSNPNQYSRSFNCEGFHLPMPRCARCKSVHERGRRWSIVAWVVSAALLITALKLVSGAWVMSVVLGLVVSIFPAGLVMKWLSKAPGVRSDSDIPLVESYPPVAGYLREGWGITQYHAKANRQRHPLWRRG